MKEPPPSSLGSRLIGAAALRRTYNPAASGVLTPLPPLTFVPDSDGLDDRFIQALRAGFSESTFVHWRRRLRP